MAHPKVQELIDLAKAEKRPMEEIDFVAGYSTGTLARWSTGDWNPRLLAFVDYAGALRHRVELVPDEPIFIPAFLPVRRRRG